MTVSDVEAQVGTELDRQVDVLVGLGYPALAGITEQELRTAAEAWRAAIEERWEREWKPRQNGDTG